MSLKRKATLGAFWSFINSFFLKGSVFFVSLFLARILGPEAFGIIGMITVFFFLGNVLIDGGLSESLIRFQNITNKDYSSVFVANIAISLIIYLIIFVSAPFIAIFYDQAILTDLIRVYCLSFIFAAFYTVQQTKLTKELKFKKIAILELPSYLIGCLIGVFLGISGYGVWSLVFMHLTIQTLRGIIFSIFGGWTPSFKFELATFKKHYFFGYKLMLSGIIDTFFNHAYNIIIGKFFSVSALGHFERSKSLQNYPVTAITSIINKVTFPLLAGLQNDPARLSKIFQQLIQFSFFIIAPLMLGLAALAEPLFDLILGNQWTEAILFFQILCLSSIFYPIHAFNVNILKVCGRSDLFLKLVLIKKFLIVIGICVAIKFGIIALLWSTLVSTILSLFINTHYNKSLIDYPVKKQLIDIIPTLISSLIMAFLIHFSMNLFPDLSTFLKLVIGSLLGLTYYALINLVFKPEPFLIVLNSIKQRKLVIN